MKYMCEVCEIPYDTTKEADDCELKHKVEAKKKKELENTKKERWQEVLNKKKEYIDAANKYYDEFHIEKSNVGYLIEDIFNSVGKW